MTIVVDASVAAMWFLPEPGSDRAALLLIPEYDLVAPDLILLEVGSAILKAVRRKEVSPADGEEAVEELLPAAVRILPAAQHAGEAFRIAQRLGGSLYDAVYVSLAKSLGAPVVTNDEQLAAVARKAQVKAVMIAEGPPALPRRQP